MYSGTVILENGEIVRVERSARNQRPVRWLTARESLPAKRSHYCPGLRTYQDWEQGLAHAARVGAQSQYRKNL